MTPTFRIVLRPDPRRPDGTLQPEQRFCRDLADARARAAFMLAGAAKGSQVVISQVVEQVVETVEMPSDAPDSTAAVAPSSTAPPDTPSQ